MSNINTSLKSHNSQRTTDLRADSMDLADLHRRTLTETLILNKNNSKAFDSAISVNPLVAASAALLATITNLKKQISQQEQSQLHQILLQEIKIFEEKARKQNFRSAIILAARYFLCAFLDETLSVSYENCQIPWQHPSLLQAVQGENWGGERFFMILERASDDPQSHIDLLEVGFLCLALGYRGKYLKENYPIRELENIKDNLLMLIHKVRGYPPASLWIKNENVPMVTKVKTKKFRFPHLAFATVLLISGSLSIYFTYKSHLSHVAEPLSKVISTLSVNT